MDDEIQFGEVQYDQPDRSLRPDRDGHYAVVACGSPPDGDLPIFVDLDVMRDMEAHSQTDTTVELGGVLLGQRYLDDHDQPFVVVTDCLRAEHYESSQSRFKFTHETWSEITRQRSGYPNDTEMVGWYHTHPGWGVFLSDMDLFICNNFFSRPLDVALVIDPRKQTRGWFQWTDDSATETRQCAGFYLMTNRHRENELEYFRDLYNGEASMSDPRYSQIAQNSGGGSAPVINVSDNRNPMFDLALMGMLAMQFILLALIAWRMMAPPAVAESAGDLEQAVEIRNLNQDKKELQGLLIDLVDPESENKEKLNKLFSQFEESQTENRRLVAGYEAQLVQTEKIINDNAVIKENLDAAQASRKALSKDYDETVATLKEKMARIEELEAGSENEPDSKDPKDKDSEEAGGLKFEFGNNWWWALLGCLLASIGSVAGTLFYMRRQQAEGYDEEEEFENEGSSESTET